MKFNERLALLEDALKNILLLSARRYGEETMKVYENHIQRLMDDARKMREALDWIAYYPSFSGPNPQPVFDMAKKTLADLDKE